MPRSNIKHFHSLKQGLTDSPRSDRTLRGGSRGRGPDASTQVERAALYYASAAQDMHSRACGVCISEEAGVRSLRAARERLPSARELAEFTARAVRTDVRALPPMLKLMLNKRRPGI